MIVSCPNCNKKFKISEKLIPDNGRLLQCSNCNHKWHFTITIKNNEIVECPAIKTTQLVDLTGAGDLFAAGYLHGVINNLSVKESLVKGTELSSKIIQKIGARI